MGAKEFGKGYLILLVRRFLAIGLLFIIAAFFWLIIMAFDKNKDIISFIETGILLYAFVPVASILNWLAVRKSEIIKIWIFSSKNTPSKVFVQMLFYAISYTALFAAGISIGSSFVTGFDSFSFALLFFVIFFSKVVMLIVINQVIAIVCYLFTK